ncbi:YeeE/YedE family protein [Paracoccus sp. (in: a-proteobacteria)]|uniref:YeeE/YedE family protein n=1 Tax=Paracoccus sp. TaxID=267 RepID=UPI003A895DB0
MNPDWIAGLTGGVMIGCAAALYLLGNGRIMGASGILGGLVDGTGRANAGERLALVLGLALMPALLVRLGLGLAHAPAAGTGTLILGGLLVGFGTRLGNGCTSGHGVCGIPRLSRRSIVATVVYLLAGGVAVLLVRALGGQA